MDAALHGLPEEVKVGDTVETALGVGVVVRVSPPVRQSDQAMLQIDLGKKWLNVGPVRSIVRHPELHHLRQEPEAGWDEHE